MTASPSSRPALTSHTGIQYTRDFEGAADCLNRLLVVLNGDDRPGSRERIAGGSRNGDRTAHQAARPQKDILPPIVGSGQSLSASMSSCRSAPILQRNDAVPGIPRRNDSMPGSDAPPMIPSSVLAHAPRKAARQDGSLPRVACEERSHQLSCEEELVLLQARFGDEIDRLRTQLCEREEELRQLRARECGEAGRTLAATEAQTKLDAQFQALEAELAEARAHGVNAQAESDRELAVVLSRLQSCEVELEDLRARDDCAESTAHELASLRVQLQNARNDHHVQELDLEVSQLDQQLEERDAELEVMRAQVCCSSAVAEELALLKSKCQSHEQELMEAREVDTAKGRLCECEDELESLRASHACLSLENEQLEAELSAKTAELKRLERDQEKQLDDAVGFVRKIAQTSAESQLDKTYNIGTMDVLGMGNYGFVVVCKRCQTSERVVLKLQSERWAGVAVREWSHGSELLHAHIVRYVDAVMHKDANYEIKARLRAAFADGTLQGREPKFFPRSYFCLGIEFMDRGTLQRFIEEQPLDARSVGAVTRQVASALAYMHKKQRTHNDIKPENVLLRVSPAGDHLIAKLADLGLADHSMDRNRDCELFAYTVWCLGLRCAFERCPSSEVDRRQALHKFRAAGSGRAASGNRRSEYEHVWESLESVIEGMWREDGCMAMADVDYLEPLQDLVIGLPTDEGVVEELEAHALRDAERRCRTVSEFYYKNAVRATSMPNLSKDLSPSTSEDDSDGSSDTEAESIEHQRFRGRLKTV